MGPSELELDPYRLTSLEKPRLRGWIHVFALIVSIPAGIALVALAPSFKSGFVAGIFAFTATNMLATSSTFHRGEWTDSQWLQLRKLDHTSIYFLIAGSYTPIVALSLDGWVRTTLLLIVWVGALGGIVLRWSRVSPPRGMMNSLFLGLSWTVVFSIPVLWREAGPEVVYLIAAQGVLYTGGALVVGSRKPNPWPRTFGYHEIWHVCTVIGLLLHFVAIGFYVFPNV